jgi:hypothetical protein
MIQQSMDRFNIIDFTSLSTSLYRSSRFEKTTDLGPKLLPWREINKLDRVVPYEQSFLVGVTHKSLWDLAIPDSVSTQRAPFHQEVSRPGLTTTLRSQSTTSDLLAARFTNFSTIS